MFRKKVEVPTPRPELIAVTENTVSIIRGIVLEPRPEHEDKLNRVSSGRLGIPNPVSQELVGADFRYFIKPDFVKRFYFHALMKGDREGGIPSMFWAFDGDSIGPWYVGDVPDFALDNAVKALSCGVRYLTIHSLKPLPVVRAMCDPVMVGWVNNPQIRLFDRVVLQPQLAVVIAIWDNDKELEI